MCRRRLWGPSQKEVEAHAKAVAEEEEKERDETKVKAMSMAEATEPAKAAKSAKPEEPVWPTVADMALEIELDCDVLAMVLTSWGVTLSSSSMVSVARAQRDQGCQLVTHA